VGDNAAGSSAHRSNIALVKTRTDSRDATPDPIRAESTPLCDTHDKARVAKIDNYAMEWPESYGIQTARSQSLRDVGWAYAGSSLRLFDPLDRAVP
jgi:hypothetical protein